MLALFRVFDTEISAVYCFAVVLEAIDVHGDEFDAIDNGEQFGKIGIADNADAFSFNDNTNSGLALVFVLLQHAFNAAAFIFFIELRKNALAFRPVVVLKRYARDGYFDQAVAGIIIAFSFLRLQRGGFGLFRFLRGGLSLLHLHISEGGKRGGYHDPAYASADITFGEERERTYKKQGGNDPYNNRLFHLLIPLFLFVNFSGRIRPF